MITRADATDKTLLEVIESQKFLRKSVDSFLTLDFPNQVFLFILFFPITKLIYSSQNIISNFSYLNITISVILKTFKWLSAKKSIPQAPLNSKSYLCSLFIASGYDHPS